MKRGTKIGWLLVAVSVVMSIWVIASQSAAANTVEGDFEFSDSTKTYLVAYYGNDAHVVMPNTVETMNPLAFNSNETIESIVLSDHLTSIPGSAFNGCGRLSSVTIPESVQNIGKNAFYGTALSSVTIPSSVTGISLDAFDQCENLTNISVAAGNSSFSSMDGCLYGYSGTKLLYVPRSKTSVSIPSGTKTIGEYAFTDCSYITSVTIPSGVTTIEAGAFSNSSIDKITIPPTVTQIGSQSGWVPAAVYGDAGSKAESFAKDELGTNFYANPETSSKPDDKPSDTDQPGNDKPNPDKNPSGDADNDTQTPGTNNKPSGDNSTVTTPGNTSTTGGTANTNTTTVAGGASVKDATPTTADPLDARFFLCFAVFAGGVGVILYSKFNKMKYVSQKSGRR